MSLAEGSAFGQYRIESLIGRGGMGAVYVARDERLGRRVALKLLSQELAEQPAFRDRFIAESRTAASLDHPHIVPIYEAGEVDGQLFIAMRYVPGVDLDGLIRRSGPLSSERAVRIVAQVADALDAAHAAGLIHRDVKPGNILITTTSGGDDHAYLSDFGLTKQAAFGGGFTRTGQVVGTVDYVAPEQIEGKTIDSRVDIYSLGCVLYEALTGTPPFRRETEVAVLFAHVQAEAPSAHAVREEVPEALDIVIAKAVSKDPEERFATAGDLGRAAVAALAGEKPVEAGTRGFLFADLRGYTDFVERNGDDAAAALLDRYRRMVREVVDRQKGAEVRTEGDSFYVLFPSASRAVTAGLEIVSEAAKRSADQPDAPITVGVGVHAGETAETAEGPVGSAVNLAARICAQAAAGEVLVSDTVRGLTRTRQVAVFEAAGSRKLKGVAEPMPLFRALAPGTVIATGGRGRTPTAPLTSLRTGEGPWRWLVIGVVVVLLAGVAGVAALGAFGGSPASASPSLIAGVGSPTPDASAGNSSDPSIEPTTGPSANSSPTASAGATMSVPTGTRIVYSRQVGLDGCDNGGFDAKLYVADPDQPDIPSYRMTSRTDLHELKPAATTDGSLLAFVGTVQGRFQPEIFSLPPQGEPHESLGAGDVAQVSIAPDGSDVIYSAFEAIWRAPVDGSEPSVVAGIEPPEDPEGEQPEPSEFFMAATYLPDGQILTIVDPGTGDPATMEAMLADGSGRQPLDIEFDLAEGTPTRLAVAPDGDTVAIQLDTEAGASISMGHLENDLADLEVLDVDVASPRAPAFSPDSTFLAFHAGEPGFEQVYRIDLESRDMSQVTEDENSMACGPAWMDAPADLVQPRAEPAPGEPRVFERGILEEGPYLLDVVQPNMGLTFPSGWFARRNFVDGWSVARRDETLPQEVDSGRIQVGLSGPCGDDESIILGPRPADLMNWIGGREDLVVGPATAINLGGYPGLTVDVQPREGAGCVDPECPDCPEGWVLFFIGEDTDFMGDPNEALRLVAIDVNGTTFAYQVYSDADNIDAYWEDHALPLLRTLTFPTE